MESGPELRFGLGWVIFGESDLLLDETVSGVKMANGKRSIVHVDPRIVEGI
ncbi:MAG: hypothetical protein ABGX22_02995 [Pirellulaceae bacterium]|jgi:hypothetical protein